MREAAAIETKTEKIKQFNANHFDALPCEILNNKINPRIAFTTFGWDAINAIKFDNFKNMTFVLDD